MHRDAHPDDRAVVEPILEGAVGQPRDDAPHGLFGVVLHVPHVGLHDVQPEVIDHAQQFLAPFLVGCDLRPQVGDVLRGIARRMASARQQRHQFVLADAPRAIDALPFDQPEIDEPHALLVERARKRRHRARRDAADVGVVAARTDVEQHGGTGAIEDRSDDGHVGQVGTPVVGIVDDIGIAGHHAARRSRA